MAKVVCISCVKSKRNHRCRAEELYTGTLFTKGMKYAKTLNPDKIFILSAEYGLLELDDEVSPYEKTLKKMKKPEKLAWAEKVVTQLKAKANLQKDEFVFLAGKDYRNLLMLQIKNYSVPMYGLPIGKQLGWLTERVG